MAKRGSRYGRSLLLTALVGALIGSSMSLRSAMNADLTVPGGSGGSGGYGKSSSSLCSDRNCESGTSSAKSSEKKEERKNSQSSESGNTNNQGGNKWNNQGLGTTGGASGTTGGIGDARGGGEQGGDIAGGNVPPVNRGDGSDEWRKRAEEERKQAEEDWRRGESERKRIEEEAKERLRREEEERQHRMEEARKNTQTPEGGKKEDVQQGCFSISGEWTTDRALCMQPTPTVTQDPIEQEHDEEDLIKRAKEEELRKQMEVRYVAAPETEQKRMVLLTLISETSKRLIALRDTGIVTNPEQRQFVESSIEWLRGGEAYFSEGRSDEELDQMVGYIRQIAEYAQEVVKEVRTAAASAGQAQTHISDIFLRTERLLLVFPDVLAILTREGIAVDPSISSDYDTIVQYFQTVKTSCATNANSCTALEDVLTGMQHLQVSVQSAIAVAGKPEVEALIHEVVEARTK